MSYEWLQFDGVFMFFEEIGRTTPSIRRGLDVVLSWKD